MKTKTAELEAAFEAQYEKYEEKIALLEQEKAAVLEATLQKEQERTTTEQQHTLVESLVARFQQVPVEVLSTIWKIRDPERLRRLIVEVVRVPDIGTFAQMVEQAAHDGNGSQVPGP